MRREQIRIRAQTHQFMIVERDRDFGLVQVALRGDHHVRFVLSAFLQEF